MDLKERIEFNKKQLQTITVNECDLSNLKKVTKEEVYNILNSKEICSKWIKESIYINNTKQEHNLCGVNYGDSRTLFYIAVGFNCSSILEVGTHIGTSTIHLLSALKYSDKPRMITVDIKDVNGKGGKWKEYGFKKNPKQLTDYIYKDVVQYVTQDSLEYMNNCKEKFDLIFLDGLHTAKRVCQELEIALQLLNKDGIIILHDYYPEIKQMFEGRDPISGPFMGVKHFKTKNNIKIIPIDELTWETYEGSFKTSLALVTK